MLTPDDDVARYEIDARSGQGRAAAVVRPADVAGVRAVLAWARRHRLRLVPQGANSGLVGASVPDATGTMVVLSLERVTSPLRVDAVDRVARVGAGVRLSQLNEAAGAHGLCFPIDLGSDPSLGGMVATNTGGARLLRYGDVRHNLLALEVVLADDDGTVLRCGRGLRKDNTGLDLKQVFVGTGGELGVITAVTVQLHPVPRWRAAALVALPDDAASVRLLQRLEREVPTELTAYELLSAEAFGRTLAHTGTPCPFADGVPPQTALVELTSGDDDADLTDRLAEVLSGAEEITDARFGPPEHWWGLRHRVTESVKAFGTVVAFDVSVPRPLVPELRARTLALLAARAPGAVLSDFGHVGDGGVHLNLLYPRPALAPTGEALAALRTAVYDVVDALGGSFSAEHGVGPRNEAWAGRYLPPEVDAVMAVLKARFDPFGVLGTRHRA